MDLDDVTKPIDLSLFDATDIVFMALVLWREARGESNEGKIAVAHCIMNRVYHPKWWGKCVTDVLFKKWQFSSITDPHDKQLTAWPLSTSAVWQTCLSIAKRVINDELPNPVPGADSYFDISILSPDWATSKTFVKQIGRLKFYNTDAK